MNKMKTLFIALLCMGVGTFKGGETMRVKVRSV